MLKIGSRLVDVLGEKYTVETIKNTINSTSIR
jgi:hypothetical protein